MFKKLSVLVALLFASACMVKVGEIPEKTSPDVVTEYRKGGYNLFNAVGGKSVVSGSETLSIPEFAKLSCQQRGRKDFIGYKVDRFETQSQESFMGFSTSNEKYKDMKIWCTKN